jgi:molybdopterin-guanine dinucleotide biosynthesis protein A
MTKTDSSKRHHSKLAFALLAGGQGRRVGKQNKGLILWQGKPLVAYALDWVFSEAQKLDAPFEVVVVSNDRMDEYQAILSNYDYPIQLLSDRYAGFLGPLAGMETVFSHTRAPFIQCLPCDCPEPPPGLVERLMLYQNQNKVLIPKDAQRDQPLFAQLSRDVWPAIIYALETEKLAVYQWMKTQSYQVVEAADLIDEFKNINQLEN